MQTKLPNVGTSIFSKMSALANQHQAINLSQGFPEFDTPAPLKTKLAEYCQQGMNQYAPSSGVPKLQKRIADLIQSKYNASIDAEACITVTSGATEALFVAIQAVVSAGDEVIVFDPVYDSYEPAIHLVDAKAIHIPLVAPDFRPPWDAVEQAITPRTRAIIVNTPHNPSATTFQASDIQALKRIAVANDLVVISDEVYEHICFDGREHHGVLRDPELFKRSFVVSSFGKTFHCTGWKVGYCVAPPVLTAEFRKLHQYVTFSTFTPAQLAIADMLHEHGDHIGSLNGFYQHKRDILVNALADSRFTLLPSEGTYFLLLDYSAMSDKNDVEFCKHLVKTIGVAAIPLSVFYETPPDSRVIRLCFAKHDDTLLEAAQRLVTL